MKQLNTEDFAFISQLDLFHGLTVSQLQTILNTFNPTIVELEAGDVLIHEGDVSDKIFVIKEGVVDVFKKDPDSDTQHRITSLKRGSVIGEMGLIDNSPRSASIIVKYPTKFIVFNTEKFNDIETHPSLYRRTLDFFGLNKLKKIHTAILHNLAKRITQNVRATNVTVVEGLKNELEHMRARSALTNVIITCISLLAFYSFLEKIISYTQPFNPTFLTVPILLFCLIPIFYSMRISGYPLRMYGFTLKHWDVVAVEAVIATLPVLILITIYKYIMMKFTSVYPGQALIAFNSHISDASLKEVIGIIIIYICFVPIQEIIVRGALQSTLQEFFVGHYKIFWAIICSNLMFSAFHLHISIGVSFGAFLSGIFWGYLYAYQRSLIGVTISHLLIGFWSFFMVSIV